MSHELLQFFTFAHLPPHLQAVSQPFTEVATAIDDCMGDICDPVIEMDVHHLQDRMCALLPFNCEYAEMSRKLRSIRSFVSGYGTQAGGLSKSGALRLLLEAKDCAVRAVLFKPAPAGDQSA